MGALNRGELVAGVADEHAGLPDGPIADRDALDELGDRARRRSAHRSPCRQSVRRCTSQQHLVYYPSLLLPTSRGCLQQCACINAASSSFFSLLYTTWGSDRGVGVANLIFICSPNCCNILLFISFKFELGCL
jgi:hypothetical protein